MNVFLHPIVPPVRASGSPEKNNDILCEKKSETERYSKLFKSEFFVEVYFLNEINVHVQYLMPYF